MPGPYAPFLYDACVGTLCAATATGPSLLLKERIVHQVFPLLQGIHLFIEILSIGVVFEQPIHFLSHFSRTLMLEFLSLFLQPVFLQGRASISDQGRTLADLRGSHDNNRESGQHLLDEHQYRSGSTLHHLEQHRPVALGNIPDEPSHPLLTQDRCLHRSCAKNTNYGPFSLLDGDAVWKDRYSLVPPPPARFSLLPIRFL
jgi:hypothetical protein